MEIFVIASIITRFAGLIVPHGVYTPSCIIWMGAYVHPHTHTTQYNTHAALESVTGSNRLGEQTFVTRKLTLLTHGCFLATK